MAGPTRPSTVARNWLDSAGLLPSRERFPGNDAWSGTVVPRGGTAKGGRWVGLYCSWVAQEIPQTRTLTSIHQKWLTVVNKRYRSGAFDLSKAYETIKGIALSTWFIRRSPGVPAGHPVAECDPAIELAGYFRESPRHSRGQRGTLARMRLRQCRCPMALTQARYRGASRLLLPRRSRRSARKGRQE